MFTIFLKKVAGIEDGKTYQVEYYNLDVIMSVGYRVKSIQGTKFNAIKISLKTDFFQGGLSIHNSKKYHIYTKNFKLNAIWLIGVRSGNSYKVVRNLEISPNMLSRWIWEYRAG